jgi:hypothetical protein
VVPLKKKKNNYSYQSISLATGAMAALPSDQADKVEYLYHVTRSDPGD